MSTLNDLQPPQIIEELSLEEILTRMKDDLLARDPEFSAYLESDPLIKLMEVAAYRELILRQRINNAAQANLLAFATGSDLDQLGLFYGVIRAEGEVDDIYRNRINARIIGWSTAGSRDAYRYHALTSDTRVKDAIAYSPEPGLVRIAILSNEDNGNISDDLLQSVKTYITRDDIKVLTDTIEVIPCNIIKVNVKAKMVLMSSTPQEILETIATSFSENFNQLAGLGVSISRTWIIANLFQSGIQDVELITPEDDVYVTETECAYLENVELILG